MTEQRARRFREVRATGTDWRAVSRGCVDQLRGLPSCANLGFVYASEPLADALDLIVAELRAGTGVRDWVGTGGAGVCGSGHEHVGEGAVVALIASLPPGSFRLFELADHARSVAPELCRWAGQRGAGLGVVHGDPRQAELTQSIGRLAQATGAFLVGGLSSAARNPIQIAGAPTEGGLSGVLLSQDVPVITALSQGCTPIGPAHEVTACQGRWVGRLDGRPALEVLREEIGEILARQLERIGGFIHAALLVPGSDRGDYLVRNLVGVDPKRGAVGLAALARRGERIMFVKRDGMSAQKDLRRMVEGLLARTQGRPVRGALYHACIARGPHMFGPDSTELRTIGEALGPVPLAGVFAGGEIFHDRLYAYTGVLTLFL